MQAAVRVLLKARPRLAENSDINHTTAMELVDQTTPPGESGADLAEVGAGTGTGTGTGAGVGAGAGAEPTRSSSSSVHKVAARKVRFYLINPLEIMHCKCVNKASDAAPPTITNVCATNANTSVFKSGGAVNNHKKLIKYYSMYSYVVYPLRYD